MKNITGLSADHYVVKHHNKINSFQRGSYSYFIGTVYELDFYSKNERARLANVTRTRLTRICKDDNSYDLVTKINMHLACKFISYLLINKYSYFSGGKKPADYADNPIFEYESSFLSPNGDRLFVLFSTVDNKYLSCSYSMNEIERHFDEIWNQCQTIKNPEDFAVVIFFYLFPFKILFFSGLCEEHNVYLFVDARF